MKKANLLLESDALSYGASNTADIAVNICPGRLNNDSNDFIKANKGMAIANTTTDLTAKKLPSENTVVNVTTTQNPTLFNLGIKNNLTVSISNFRSFRPTGANTAEFPVSVRW